MKDKLDAVARCLAKCDERFLSAGDWAGEQGARYRARAAAVLATLDRFEAGGRSGGLPALPDDSPTFPIDAGLEAQRAAEAHLAACWEALEATGDEAQTPASAPFDGCETCCVRETLHAAWPVFERWARENPEVVHGAA